MERRIVASATSGPERSSWSEHLTDAHKKNLGVKKEPEWGVIEQFNGGKVERDEGHVICTHQKNGERGPCNEENQISGGRKTCPSKKVGGTQKKRNKGP